MTAARGPDRMAPPPDPDLGLELSHVCARHEGVTKDAWAAGWRRGWDDGAEHARLTRWAADPDTVAEWARRVDKALTAEQRWELAGHLMLALVAERRPEPEQPADVKAGSCPEFRCVLMAQAHGRYHIGDDGERWGV